MITLSLPFNIDLPLRTHKYITLNHITLHYIIYVHTYIHTYIQTNKHTYIHTYNIHTYIHTYIQTNKHTYIHTYNIQHTYRQTDRQTDMMIATPLQRKDISVTVRSDLCEQPCASLVLVRICRLHCAVDRCLRPRMQTGANDMSLRSCMCFDMVDISRLTKQGTTTSFTFPAIQVARHTTDCPFFMVPLELSIFEPLHFERVTPSLHKSPPFISIAC